MRLSIPQNSAVIFILGCALTFSQGCTMIHRTSYDQKPFQQIRPEAKLRVLFVGDSTAVGTGTGNRQTSVAGWFAKDHPEAHIVNRSRNGYKLLDVLHELEKQSSQRYDLIVVQAGANDILRLTRLNSVRRNLEEVIKKSKAMSDHVAVLHSGNVGTAPIFWWPLTWIYSSRTQAVRNIYLEAEQRTGIYYIDLYALDTDELFLKDKKKYYAGDYLHLSAEGYRVWYQAIRDELQARNVNL